jgi:two-component system response regulator QseB
MTTRVLVVEDEDLIRELMVETLRSAGFEVDEASTGQEAEELIFADGYKLMVTDVHMPGAMNGMDFAERANDLKPGIPIIFVTARPDVLRRLDGSDIVAKVLSKPFSLESLARTVRSMIDHSVI